MVKILHTEASTGWGGQEIRILKEAEGMRERGHTVLFATEKNAELARVAREKGFTVHQLSYSWRKSYLTIFQLMKIIKKEKIDLVNTHSSLDAWLGGIAGKLSGSRLIRTRHVSSSIKPGINSLLLFRLLADKTVTTCERVKEIIMRQAGLTEERCLSIPTGIDPLSIHVSSQERKEVREGLLANEEDIVIGSLCILRSWKGVNKMIECANLLKDIPNLRWVIAGSGPFEPVLKNMVRDLGLEKNIIFTGFLENPYPTLSAMDIFLLLSSANEGVSQAALQAAYLEKPLITTLTGGLPEICINGKTGYLTSSQDPSEIAGFILALSKDTLLRESMGKAAKALVLEKFTFDKTLDRMEALYFD